MELKFFADIRNIPDEYFTDDQYDDMMAYVREQLVAIAEGLEGRLADLEIT